MNLKKIVAAILSVCVILPLVCSCGRSNPKQPQYYDYADLSQYITVANYKGIKVDLKSDEFVSALTLRYNNDLKSLNMYDKQIMPQGTAIQNGDTAQIDYEGKLNGVAFEGGTAKNYSLEIGSGTFIDGFESGLIGVKSGETVDLNLTFPANYQSTELAGKAVVFTVTVNKVVRFVYKEMTDTFAREIGNYNNLEEYKAAVQQEEIENYVWAKQIVGNSTVVKYPETELQKNKDYFSSILSQYTQIYSQDTINSIVEERAKSLTKEELVATYIARKEKLVSDEDIQKEIDNLAANHTEKQEKDAINSLIARKVNEYVLAQAEYINK